MKLKLHGQELECALLHVIIIVIIVIITSECRLDCELEWNVSITLSDQVGKIYSNKTLLDLNSVGGTNELACDDFHQSDRRNLCVSHWTGQCLSNFLSLPFPQPVTNE